MFDISYLMQTQLNTLSLIKLSKYFGATVQQQNSLFIRLLQ